MSNFFNRLFRSPETNSSAPAPAEDSAEPAANAATTEHPAETTPAEPEYTFDDLKNEPFAGDLAPEAQEPVASEISQTPAASETTAAPKMPEVIGGGGSF